MTVPVCGRFENAPAHLIITGPRFNPRDIYGWEKPTVKPTKEQKEARRIERETLAKIKAECKRELEAEKLQRRRDWIPGETSSQRRNRRDREARQARETKLIDALPSGYEPLLGMELPVCYEIARKALSKGNVHGIKVGLSWYTSRAVLVSYFVQNHARHMKAMKKNRKGRKNEQKSR
jgi:hypothetical protein